MFAFRKAADGEYFRGSVIDITDRTQATLSTPCSVALHIHASPQLAGYTAYVMTVHYHRYPDMFSRYMQDSFVDEMRANRDIGFDGAALDEFRYLILGKPVNETFPGRFHSGKRQEIIDGVAQLRQIAYCASRTFASQRLNGSTLREGMD